MTGTSLTLTGRIFSLFKRISIRNYILLLLLLGFFLPWVSYGFITKSGYELPLYMDELKRAVAFFSQGKYKLPDNVEYLYLIYNYPLFLVMNFIWKSRILLLITGSIPLLALGAGYLISKLPFTDFLGYGAYLTLFLSVILLIYTVLPKRLY